MISFEQQLIARAVASATGRLPESGARLPVIRLRQVRARVLDNSFYWKDKTRPAVGELIVGDHDDIVGLARRSLVELVP